MVYQFDEDLHDLSLFISKSSWVSQIDMRINKHRGTKLLVIKKIPVLNSLFFTIENQRNTVSLTFIPQIQNGSPRILILNGSVRYGILYFYS